ncbi:MAG: flavin reductase family protein, partial [Deltaproteobacteria bacterium]|nr:flavin reductase family protein [Deltaproteobacteria bacterium]
MEKVKIGPSTHLHPKPAVLVGALVDEKPNFMTVSWCGIASQEPPAISVAIRKIRHTLKGIREHGVFSVNVPGVDLARKVDFCGIYSGKEKDKSELFGVFYGESKTAPLVEECPVNFECRVMHTLDLGSHFLVVGEILETYVFKDCLAGKSPDVEKIDPLIYASGT